jgi:uncharacterized protein DUF5946
LLNIQVSTTTACPGCGLVRPGGTWVGTGRVNASAECEALLAELAGFESTVIELGRFRQMTVDAYGAQHAGHPTKPIRVAYSLVGLHLALDRKVSGAGVRTAHSLMGKPQPDWPGFDSPRRSPAITVLDVVDAGAHAGSVAGHAAAMLRWAEAVWLAWTNHHSAVVELTARLFTGGEAFWRMTDTYQVRPSGL